MTGSQDELLLQLERLRAYIDHHHANGAEGFVYRGSTARPVKAPPADSAAIAERPAAAASVNPPAPRPTPPPAPPSPSMDASPGLPPPPDPVWDDDPEEPAFEEDEAVKAAPRAQSLAGLADATTLPEIREVIGDCRRCKLAGSRTNIVFGVGNPNADLMFVGEGPGRDEDLKAEPFVGRAGQLLTEIITKGMKLRREDVFIANVVKCRPPENRNPEPDEIAACSPFLTRQIEIVKPKVLVALGKFAAQTMLATTTPIMRLRGNWHEYQGIKLMPTLHPAYLLRNPADKKLVWEDIKLVMKELGLHE